MTTKKPSVIKSHFIPQGYLRNFLVTKDSLYVLNKKYGRIRATSTAGVGYQPDFYLVDTIDEKNSLEVEKSFSQIESTCIPLLRKLTTTADITNSERADVAIYIALQYGRTPHARSRMDKVATIVGTNEIKQRMADAVNDPTKYDEMVADLSKSNPGVIIPTREKLIEWILKPGPLANIKIDNGTYVKLFFEHAWRIAEGLLDAQWVVYRAPKGSRFVTSDNPIVLKLARELKEYETLGILMPGMVRYFPLSSTHCLVIHGNASDRKIRREVVSKQVVRAINSLTTSQANLYVISGSKALLESLKASS